MNQAGSHPSEPRILAFFDGELASSEAAEVERHLAGCERCGQVLHELAEVQRMMASSSAAGPLRPVWPQVRGRIVAPPLPLFRPAFAAASTAVALLGVLLGVMLGSAGHRTHEAQGVYLWSVAATTLVEDGGDRLQDWYPAAASGEGR